MHTVLLAAAFVMIATPAPAGPAYPEVGRRQFMAICTAETPRPICSCALQLFEARMTWPDYIRLDTAYRQGRQPDRALSQVANQVYDICIVNTDY